MKRCAILLSALFCVGCNPFWLEMTFEAHDPAAQTTALSSDELSKVLAAVAQTASTFGLKASESLEGPYGLKAMIEKDDRWPNQLLAFYKRKDEKTQYSRIDLQVLRNKATDEVSVTVEDRDGGSYEEFTKDLEAALSTALASALPSRRVVVVMNQ